MNNKKNECKYKGGSYMVARNLHAIKHALEEILPLVHDHDEIESWIEHKVSVAKEAISSVRDALMYNDEEEHDMHGEEEISMDMLVPKVDSHDDLGLGKIMGGCGMSNEGRVYLGSGSINEKKQLVTNNSKEKIIVESARVVGGLMRVKTKSGKIYEYSPYYGTELEALRLEDYNINVKR